MPAPAQSSGTIKPALRSMLRRCPTASMASSTLPSRRTQRCLRSRCRSLFRENRGDHRHQCFPQRDVLVRIEMDAVDAARRSHTTGVEEMTAQYGSDLAIGICETATSLVGAQKLRGDETLRRTDRWWANNQDRWHRHP